ncbi:MAG: hypothetical protein JWN00_2097, partial [Actinomycetia bacterium]|nr:hypothetical protein [Actinomycetes bacterium]
MVLASSRLPANHTTPTAVEGNVARARRPKKPTRAARRAIATESDTYTRPDRTGRKHKSGPTPKRPTGVWFPPPPQPRGADSVRRDKHPRRTTPSHRSCTRFSTPDR